MAPGPGGTIPDHFGKSLENPAQPSPNPTRIPKYFGPFLDIRGQTDPTICSASRFPAGGAGQNPISAHEAPHQAQNHVFGRPRFWAPRKISGAAKDFRRCEGFQAVRSNPCASGVAQFLFFPEKCTSWKKVTCHLGMFGRFWDELGNKMTQHVPGLPFSQ